MLVRWLRSIRREKPLGRRGEDAAVAHLKRLGYQLLACNHRGPLGELDLVMADGRTVVFVEVKTRRSTDAGHALEVVDLQKQRRLSRLALAFLKRHDLLEHPARFDVVAVIWPQQRREPTIEHVRGAFEATGPSGMFS